MTALAWVRCAWAQNLFPAAPPRTAALQSQTGNPWCWSAAGWPPDQGALTPRPVPRDECLPLGYAEPGGSLHASPKSGGSKEGGKNPGCAPQLRVQTVRGTSVVRSGWRGAAHMAPRVEVQAIESPWLICSPPGEGSARLQLWRG